MHVIWGLGGMLGLLLIAAALSTNRRAIRLRTVLPALAIQVGFGALVLFVPWGRTALRWASDGFQSVIDSATEGISFLFGPLLPDEGVVFALQVLPVVVFFASLTGVLFHLGWLQVVVRVLGGGLQRVLGTGKAESTNAAANIFLGQTEAPLVIRPYVAGLTRSGLFAVMVGGLATVAGSVLVGYSLLGADLDYLIAASFMAAPGALLMAKILVPEEPDNVASGTEFDEAEVESYSPRTQAIVTFALTGFANLSSLGILLGGLGSMAPSRRKDIASLGMRAILAATLANLMSATIAGIMLG
ncbi:nucleoside transporter [Janibacter indicus]|uniref:Nucleoside transporter n=2 Tax=Janibacter indicus TaxID=857417 RepID=A0A1W2D216_9MICO|nr:nucleoside transporter [Janibacter indicus]